MNTFSLTRPGARRRSVIWPMALAAVVGLGTVGAAVHATEMTGGRVLGRAPAGATVVVSSPDFGIHRKIQANAKGHYDAGWLPIGVYVVTVYDHNGQPLVVHRNVPTLVGGGARVDFSCPFGSCSEVASK